MDSARLDLALAFARRFHAAGPWGDAPLDEDALAAFFEHLNETGYLDVRPEGFIGGVVYPLYFSPQTLVGAELFWWSDAPAAGRELREGFEAWARGQGARFVAFSSLVDDREAATRRLYARAGFAPVETSFRKAL